MSKNIETCKSEEVLASVTEQQPQDYPSVQQAVHDLGVTALPAASAADPDIVELPSNVEVFVRRVLKAVVYDRVLPVVQQMWQAVLNRCSDYIPASLYPYASNPSLRTLGTLPTALSALSARKISNGGATSDGINDGVSLAHLLCSANQVTKIVDDNYGWIADKANALQTMMSIFDSCRDFTLNFVKATQVLIGEFYNTDRTYTFNFPYLSELGDQRIIGTEYVNRNPTFIVHAPSVKTTNQTSNTYSSFYARQIYLDNYEKGVYRIGGSASYHNPHVTYMYVGCKGKPTDTIRFWQYVEDTQLVDFEIGQGARQPITLENVTGLTAENIVNHIFEPLADNTDGDPITINIGSANLAKLTDEQKAIAQNKNYTLA